MKRLLLFLFSCLFITACSSTTVSDGVVEYSGDGKDWTAKYIYDADLYEEKKVNWVELEYKHQQEPLPELKGVHIELESREGILEGNLADMVVETEGNKIRFLVGTINRTMNKEDKIKLNLEFSDKKDKIVLKHR
ncbi:hypothetical protein [Ammoniphilus resinae]|uniref:Lipoprotein n=1 Tax=Ammoniphilus resinae TaxID=861532 RepID=A0ABS4GP82_9BACL|nr:hypothetical protein [Ammoniphilus resinae]MBP1932078.1 hypothetical protein [Ammoniphilus resinae]